MMVGGVGGGGGGGGLTSSKWLCFIRHRNLDSKLYTEERGHK